MDDIERLDVFQLEWVVNCIRYERTIDRSLLAEHVKAIILSAPSKKKIGKGDLKWLDDAASNSWIEAMKRRTEKPKDTNAIAQAFMGNLTAYYRASGE